MTPATPTLPALAVPPNVPQPDILHSQKVFSAGKISADCAPAQPAENCGFENSPSHAPCISKIDDRLITVPAGASRDVVVLQTLVNWTDGAQTARESGAPWLCVHPGAGWPDALETCQHIEALTGGAE